MWTITGIFFLIFIYFCLPRKRRFPMFIDNRVFMNNQNLIDVAKQVCSIIKHSNTPEVDFLKISQEIEKKAIEEERRRILDEINKQTLAGGLRLGLNQMIEIVYDLERQEYENMS